MIAIQGVGEIRLQLAAIRSAVSAIENLLKPQKTENFDANHLWEQSPGALLFNRDLSHFRENGRHLSDAGVKAVRELFAKGKTIEQVAAEIGISVSGASERRRDWLRSLKADEKTGAER